MTESPEQPAPQKSRRRKGWVAVLLSILLTGLGQLYNGQLRRAAIYLVLSNLAPVALILLAGSYFSIGMVVSLLALQGLIQLVATYDAWRTARRIGDNFRPAAFNRVPIYIASYLVFGLLVGGAFSYVVRAHVVQAFSIASASMRPTLLIGDQILVDKAATDYTRGDLLVFDFPPDKGKAEMREYVKRLIGLPGDVIEIRDKQVLVNGKPLAEPYVIHTDSKTIPADKQPRDFYGPVTVPEDSCFVLGDNRDRSYDSRFWGFVKKNEIVGKVAGIYWSWDRRTFEIRWGRIGSTVGAVK